MIPPCIMKSGGGGDLPETLTPPAPFTGDMAYRSTCPCYLYGVCPLLPVSEGWDGMASREGKMEEEMGHPLDMYQYSPSTYLTYNFPSPAPLANIHPAISANPAVPVITPSPSLIVVNPSPPSSSSPPPIKVPLKDEEGQETLNTMLNGVENIQNGSGGYPLRAPPPMVSPTMPTPLSHIPNGTSLQLFTEESKLGMFGADGCWYSLASMQNMTGTDHPNQHPHLPTAPLVSTVQKPSPFYSYFPSSNHTALLPTQSHSFRDPPPYIPPVSTLGSLSTSSPSSSSSLSFYPTPPFSHGSPTSGLSEAGQNGVLYYNYYQHLNVPTDVFGKPRLISSVRKEGQL